MTRPDYPDWTLLERELEGLSRTVQEVAVAAGCSPAVVIDSLAESLGGGATPPELRVVGEGG